MKKPVDIRKRLRQFWGRIHNGENRLEWLINAAQWKVPCASFYKQRRYGARRFPRPTGLCFCCQKNRATATHHVVQLQNGGRNTKKNRVPICRDCHRKIHPWLKGRSPLPRAFTTDMRPRLRKAERVESVLGSVETTNVKAAAQSDGSFGS